MSNMYPARVRTNRAIRNVRNNSSSIVLSADKVRCGNFEAENVRADFSNANWFLVAVGAAIGVVGTIAAVDYFRNKKEMERSAARFR